VFNVCKRLVAADQAVLHAVLFAIAKALRRGLQNCCHCSHSATTSTCADGVGRNVRMLVEVAALKDVKYMCVLISEHS
jgi:hypothetical protein